MSNVNGQTAEEILEEKGPGFFSKLFHLWVLPFIYVLLLGSIILHFSGESFQAQVKWLQKQEAAISKLFAKEEKTDKKATSKTASSSATDNKTSAASGNESKTNQTSTANNSQSSTSQGEQESTNQSEGSSVASSLSSMDPSKAAELLTNMTEADALKNLKQLQAETQSAIIAELPAAVGARMILALSNGIEPAVTTTSASQLYEHMKPEQIVAVLSGISSNEEILYQIKQMDPNMASKVISQLNPKVAGWIVTKLKP